MKKIILVILVVILIFVFAACGEETVSDFYHVIWPKTTSYPQSRLHSSVNVSTASNFQVFVNASPGFIIKQVICHSSESNINTFNCLTGSSGNVSTNYFNYSDLIRSWSNCNTSHFNIILAGTPSVMINRMEVVLQKK